MVMTMEGLQFEMLGESKCVQIRSNIGGAGNRQFACANTEAPPDTRVSARPGADDRPVDDAIGWNRSWSVRRGEKNGGNGVATAPSRPDPRAGGDSIFEPEDHAFAQVQPVK